ncbi:MAG: LamG-like jellyroll fold domain-containing protein [Ilumatobacteraceae bacterium]
MRQPTAVRERRSFARSWRARTSTQHEVHEWGVTLLVAAARSYLAFVGTLILVALVPLVCSWHSYVVRSGSMAPTIDVGDIVVASPLRTSTDVPLGRVMVFEDPSRTTADTTPRILIHRVITRNDDGSYTSAGDANRRWDTAELPRHLILAQARLRVPWIGLPIIWYSRRQYALIVLLVVASGLAVWLVAADVARRRHQHDDKDDGDGDGPTVEPSATRRPRIGRRASVITSAAIAAAMVGTASADFSARSVNPGNAWAVSSRTMLSYRTNVLADVPWAFYEAEEASGSAATDSSGNSRSGSFGGTITYRQVGALTRLPGFSVLLGSNGRLVASTTTLSNPTTYSVELWFKTSTTSGGKLLGFENSRNQSSTTYDRHVFMRNDGRLSYGGWTNGGTSMITTTAAYNDGKWHHLVLTARPISGSSLQSSNVFVDGVRVASGNTTAVRNYVGYWRAGAGNLPSVTGTPSSVTFEGNIDNFAVYTTELSATRVEIHYASR